MLMAIRWNSLIFLKETEQLLPIEKWYRVDASTGKYKWQEMKLLSYDRPPNQKPILCREL